MSTAWDLIVVGAGPAGAATVLGALHRDPGLRVLLLDRCDFPRDKSCGDGVAPHVLDVLAAVGAGDVLDDLPPLRRLRISLGDHTAERTMARPVWVVPRQLFDARLVDRAVAAGAHLERHRTRQFTREVDGDVLVDDKVRGKVVVGADGAYSVVRRALLGEDRAKASGRRALAIRGYAPTTAQRTGLQVIRYGDRVQPSYAWSFDRGDGLANVGYGELIGAAAPPPSCQRLRSPWRPDALTSRRRAVTREGLLAELERLLPGTTAGGVDWRAHHLPLSGWPRRHAAGRVLLAGDAAQLVNPMTGEGIYYAVATGVLAGRAAADALARGEPDSAGDRYARAVHRLLARHQRHTTVAAGLSAVPRVVAAGIEAADRSQRVFDDLVEIGLGGGTITPRLGAGLVRALATPAPRPHLNDREELPWRS